MYFRREGYRVLLCLERAFGVSIDCNDATWTGHLEHQIGIVWDRIEAGKSSSSEQCVIAIAEGDDIEDQLFASEVVRGSEDHLQCD